MLVNVFKGLMIRFAVRIEALLQSQMTKWRTKSIERVHIRAAVTHV